MSRSRLTNELRNLSAPGQCFQACPIESNLYSWVATIVGPSDTPYEGGKFRLSLDFSTTYPFSPPRVKFITEIFHPNISKDGDICLDILSNNWSPALTTEKILLSISSLLSEPNPDDPLNAQAGRMYRENRASFDQKARDMTRIHARGD